MSKQFYNILMRLNLLQGFNVGSVQVNSCHCVRHHSSGLANKNIKLKRLQVQFAPQLHRTLRLKHYLFTELN